MYLFFSIVIFGCDVAETKKSDYVPSSLEEKYMFSNYWCGYDYVAYDGLPANSKVKTLFKVDPSESGIFYISTTTMSSSVNIQDRFNILCDFLDQNTLSCSGSNINYVVQDTTLSTDLFPILIPGLNLTKLNICTKQELANF